MVVTLPIMALVALGRPARYIAGPCVLFPDPCWRGPSVQHASFNDSRRKHDYGGRLFKMYKFRTMRVDAEADGRAVWATKSDPRTTPIGKVLRRTRLDELAAAV